MDVIRTAPAQEIQFTESQREIAEGLGWADKMSISPFRELTEYIDSRFSAVDSRDPVWLQFPEVKVLAGEGEPFYAMNNQYTLAVSREYVGDKPVYKSDYSVMQASEDYQDTLASFIRHLTRGREAAVFCRVTDLPKSVKMDRRSIMTCCSAECDVFLPTGLCKGLSRRNSAHITDAEVFESIVADYTKVMTQIQKRGYELCTHFYLTRGCDIQRILQEPEAAQEIWNSGNYRDYRCVTITDEGEIVLQLRQEIEAS